MGKKCKEPFSGRIIFITSTFTCILLSAFPVDDDDYFSSSSFLIEESSEMRETRHNLCLLLLLHLLLHLLLLPSFIRNQKANLNHYDFPTQLLMTTSCTSLPNIHFLSFLSTWCLRLKVYTVCVEFSVQSFHLSQDTGEKERENQMRSKDKKHEKKKGKRDDCRMLIKIVGFMRRRFIYNEYQVRGCVKRWLSRHF